MRIAVTTMTRIVPTRLGPAGLAARRTTGVASCSAFMALLPSPRPSVLVQAGVAVEPAEEQVPEVREQRRGEAEHEQQRRAPATPAADDPGVEVGAVDEPRHE